MVIDSTIKQKVVELYQQKKGRNEICRILKAQKVRISEATITHLIQDWKRQQPSQMPQAQSQQLQHDNPLLQPARHENSDIEHQQQIQAQIESNNNLGVATPQEQQSQTNNAYTDDGINTDARGSPLSYTSTHRKGAG
jgi:hypothetical protein